MSAQLNDEELELASRLLGHTYTKGSLGSLVAILDQFEHGSFEAHVANQLIAAVAERIAGLAVTAIGPRHWAGPLVYAGEAGDLLVERGYVARAASEPNTNVRLLAVRALLDADTYALAPSQRDLLEWAATSATGIAIEVGVADIEVLIERGFATLEGQGGERRLRLTELGYTAAERLARRGS